MPDIFLRVFSGDTTTSRNEERVGGESETCGQSENDKSRRGAPSFGA